MDSLSWFVVAWMAAFGALGLTLQVGRLARLSKGRMRGVLAAVATGLVLLVAAAIVAIGAESLASFWVLAASILPLGVASWLIATGTPRRGRL